MRRWTGSLLVALLVASPLLALDKGADEKGEDRATQFKKLKQDYQTAVPKVRKALQEAETEKDRKAILDKLTKDFGPRILKLVEVDPKDKLSLDMLIWSIQALPDTDSKVYDLLTEHWAKDPKVKPLCQKFMFQPDEAARPLLQKVLDENEDRTAKGYACFALAKAAAEKDDKKSKAEAEKLYDRVSKEFAGVKIGPTSTLGDLAKGAIFEIRHLQIGMEAPNAASEKLDGDKVQLKDLQGKVVVLDFWATWCGPCRSMIPHERQMVKKLKDKPFAFISISADEKKETLKDFLDKESMPWTHWWSAPTGGIVTEWNIQAFPTMFVLDSKGVIRYKFVGANEKDLDEAVEKLLAEVKQ